MPRMPRKARKKPTDQPCLSEVELTAVQVWLRWEGAKALAQRQVWAESVKISRNSQTVSSHRYWCDAFHAITTCLANVERDFAVKTQFDTFAPNTLDPIDVIARN